MESRHNNKDFEQFLKQSADQYRMFPSENVWKGIDNALHTRRRWYGLGLALLLLLTGSGVTLVMLTTPNSKSTNSPSAKSTIAEVKIAPETPEIPSPKTTAPVTPNGPVIYTYSGTSIQATTTNLPATVSGATTETNGNSEATLTSSVPTIPEKSIATNNTPAYTGLPSEIPAIIQNAVVPTLQFDNSAPTPTETQDAEKKAENTLASTSNTVEFNTYPMTIESVINSFKRNQPSRKIAIQYYMTPTISYRKLSENKTFLRSQVSSGNVPASVAYRDVNTAVTHKPGFGLEVGASAKYPLTKSIYLRAGLQFNISRYDIRAYNNPGEIATIALDAGTGTNSISQQTIYRNYNGNRTNWLQNLYYSASIPIGAEVRFPSRKSTYFALAATAQPTYIISDRAYLLSTDYKNYVEVPSLIRRWNLNTGFEALVGYSTHNLQWQIGPQVRYQVRSSFQDQYPLKENLFDFGLKVGVTFNK